VNAEGLDFQIAGDTGH